MNSLFNSDGNIELHSDYFDGPRYYYYETEVCPDNGEVLRLDILHYTPHGLHPVDEETHQILEDRVREHAKDIIKWS